MKRSIQAKLVSLLVLCALAFVLCAAPVISYISFTNAKESANEQQARLVGAVTLSASIAAFVQNEEIAQDVIQGLLLDDEVLHARLTGDAGFSVEAGNGKEDQRLQEQLPVRYPLMSPMDDGQEVGKLLVWSNDELINQRALHSVKKNIIWLVVLSFLLCVASIIAVNRLVGAPLRKLAAQLSGLKPGTDQRIDVDEGHRRDEIGLVSESLNSFLDVTHDALETEKNLRLKIEKLDRHYRNIFASTHVGIMVLDENGFLLHNNPVLLNRIILLSEESRARLLKEEFFSVVFDDPDAAWTLVARARTSKETVSGDLAIKADGGKQAWVHCLISGSGDHDTGEQLIEAVVYDVTSRVAETSHAQRLAEEDPLTGVKNRRGCQVFFDRQIRAANTIPQYAAMLLDLDGFKPINDSLGHAAGDFLLQVVADRLRACTRSKTDLVGRFGGDEFLLLVEHGADPREAVSRVADHILNEVSKPVDVAQDKAVSVGVSIGIAFAKDHEGFDGLVESADEALYEVKKRGKHGYRFASPSRSDA